MKFILVSVFLSATCFFGGCVSKQTSSDFVGNPVEKLHAAEARVAAGSGPGEYSIDYRKAQAAAYLLSQAKTELKAGNSIKAIRDLAEARQYNPWNDEIKDFYLLSVRILVKITLNLNKESCDVLNDRLALINEVAPDRLGELSDLERKCGYSSTQSKFKNLELSSNGSQTQSEVFESFQDELASLKVYNSKKKSTYETNAYTLFVSSVPPCDYLEIEGKTMRRIKCDSNPQIVSIRPGEKQIIVKAQNYLPKNIDIRKIGDNETIQVLLENR